MNLLTKVGKDGKLLRVDNKAPVATVSSAGVQDFTNSQGVPIKSKSKSKKARERINKTFGYKMSLSSGVKDLTDLQKLQAQIMASHQPKSQELAINQAVKQFEQGKISYYDVDNLINQYKFTEKGKNALDEIAKKEMIRRLNHDPNYTLDDARQDYNLSVMTPAELAQIGTLGTLKQNAKTLTNDLKLVKQQARDLSRATRGEIRQATHAQLQQAQNLTAAQIQAIQQESAAQQATTRGTALTQLQETNRLALQADMQRQQLSNAQMQQAQDLSDAQIRQAQQIATQAGLQRQQLSNAQMQQAQQLADQTGITIVEATKRIKAVIISEAELGREQAIEGLEKQAESTLELNEIKRYLRDVKDYLRESMATTRETKTTRDSVESLAKDIDDLKKQYNATKSDDSTVNKLITDLDDLFAEYKAPQAKSTEAQQSQAKSTEAPQATTEAPQAKSTEPPQPQQSKPKKEKQKVAGDIPPEEEEDIPEEAPIGFIKIDDVVIPGFINDTFSENTLISTLNNGVKILELYADYIQISEDYKKILWDGNETSSDLLEPFINPRYVGRQKFINANQQKIKDLLTYMVKSGLNPNKIRGINYPEIKINNRNIYEEFRQTGTGFKSKEDNLFNNKKISVGSSGGVALDAVGGLELNKSKVNNAMKKEEIENIKEIKQVLMQLKSVKNDQTDSGLIAQNEPDTITPSVKMHGFKTRGTRFGKSQTADKATKVILKCFDIAEGGDPILAIDILNGIPENLYTKKDYLSAYNYIMQFIQMAN